MKPKPDEPHYNFEPDPTSSELIEEIFENWQMLASELPSASQLVIVLAEDVPEVVVRDWYADHV